MPLNVTHINKVLKHIEGDVRRLNMPLWGVLKGTPSAEDVRAPSSYAKCGTACCFAGWSHLLSVPRKKWKAEFGPTGELDISRWKETEKLGLTYAEANRLFAPVTGTPEEQFDVLKERLRELVDDRLSDGELGAKEIRV